MNKTTFYHRLKGYLVISLIFFIFSSFYYSSYYNDDYILLNKIIERVKSQNPKKTIFLKQSNNNEYIISIINQLNDFEKSENKFKLDSLKDEIGIENNIKFNSIFNQKEYSYFISQKSSTMWSFDKVFGATISSATQSQGVLYVSKPIYTKNSNFALVYINNGKTSYIVIYEKVLKVWNEYKIIAPLFIITKVTLKNN